MAKFIFAPSIETALKGFGNIQLTDSSIQKALIFTEDGYLATHGKKFKLNDVTSSEANLGGLSISGNKVTLSLNGVAQTTQLTLPVISVDKASTETALTIGTTDSAVTIGHAVNFQEAQLIAYGSKTVATSGDARTSIQMPTIKPDIHGHITEISQTTAFNVDEVFQKAAASNKTYYMVGRDGDSTSASDIVSYTDKVFFNSLGELSVQDVKLYTIDGYKSLSTLFASASNQATQETLGLVKLAPDTIFSNTTSADNANYAGGYAATPKAVKDYVTGQLNSFLALNDAMVFKGVVGKDGETTTSLPSTGYSAGWTYKVVGEGLTVDGKTAQAGDLIIAVKDYDSAAASHAGDWTIVQGNDGTIFNSDANGLTQGQLVVGGANKWDVTTLANGTVGQVLKVGATGLTWADDNNGYRAIKVDGNDFLADNVTTAVNFVGGTGVTLTKDAATGAITIGADVSQIGVQSLTLTDNNNNSISFNPAAEDATSWTLGAGLAIGEDNEIKHVTTIASAISEKVVGKISVNTLGHVTAVADATLLTVGLDADQSKRFTWNQGSTAQSLLFAAGTGTTLDWVDGKLTIGVDKSVVNYAVALSSKVADGATNKVEINLKQNAADAGTVNIVGAGHTTVGIKDNNIEVTSTWRDIQLYDNKTASTTQTLSSISDKSPFVFSKTFGLNTGDELDLVWAEVDENGNVTYEC